MDKRAKKKIDVLRKKISNLEQRLAGAKQQMDDPDEVATLEAGVSAAKAQIKRLKES